MTNTVKAWVDDVIIPTYKVGEPDKNPHFLEKRVYQGSSGVVYPHNVIDKLSDKKENVTYKAIYLENDYIKVMILPELGGRIQMAFDKTANRHFVYYNNVIKPALVGLAGPWISGGIEFNWPQHHRPTTFDEVDFTIEDHEDGSKTVWVGETEKMFRTRGLAGFRVSPTHSYIEINAKIYNGTNLPQTFLWWANPAVKASGGHQSIFPPDVNAVFDHGKRDVSRFPIATGEYYKADYSAGVDISKYDNIPVPTSYMAYKSTYDFVGSYVHDENAGLLHIADHNVVPGKKQWTWGNGDFGQAWDRNLTDEDGPYIELMTGAFTDNQPDFTWLEPYEEKTFTQYFMPYRDLAVIKNANENIALKFDINNNNNSVSVGIYTSSEVKNYTLEIHLDNKLQLTEDILYSSPKQTWLKEIFCNITMEDNFKVIILDENKQSILEYTPDNLDNLEIPAPAKAPTKPHNTLNVEELVFTGQHIEQYRHATAHAEDYYLEALKRDPLHTRANTLYATLLFRRGNFIDALEYVNNGLKRILEHNTNPFDSEAIFLKGLILYYMNKKEKSYEFFYKSIWSGNFSAKGFFFLSRLETEQHHYKKACKFLSQSLGQNGNNHKAKHLHVILERLKNNKDKALSLISTYKNEDPLEIALYFEEYLLTKDKKSLSSFLDISRTNELTFLELTNDYIQVGEYQTAIELLSLVENIQDPMIYYYMSFCYHALEDDKKSADCICKADELPNVAIFPNKIDDIAPLKLAIEKNKSYKAMYLLGNLFYNNHQYNTAIQLWQDSVKENNNFPTTHRNLSIAYYNKLNDSEQALKEILQAIKLSPKDARLIFELNDLYIKMNYSPRERLDLFTNNMDLVNNRDDMYIEFVRINNLLENYDEAQELIKSRIFHPWEGGEGKITTQYVINSLALAVDYMDNKQYDKAITILNESLKYPHNLGEGKLEGNTDNDIYLLLAFAHKLNGNQTQSDKYMTNATVNNGELAGVTFYNDQPADYIFYQGISQKIQGNLASANKCFYKLINYGKTHMNAHTEIDFFAVSLPDFIVFDDNIQKKNQTHCHFVLMLGYFGIQDMKNYNYHKNQLEQLDKNHDKSTLINNKILPLINIFI